MVTLKVSDMTWRRGHKSGSGGGRRKRLSDTLEKMDLDLQKWYSLLSYCNSFTFGNFMTTLSKFKAVLDNFGRWIVLDWVTLDDFG